MHYSTAALLKTSTYLQFLINLNYWDGNFLILFIIYINFFKYVTNLLYYWAALLSIKLLICFRVYSGFFFKKKLLNALWIGTINIHPPLFYIITTLLFGYFFFKKSLYIPTVLTKHRTLTILFLALSFGGLWGLQSLTWGYIWVNDEIEWVLLGIISYGVYFLHQIFRRENIQFKLINFLYFFIFLSSIRLNLVATRHSFLTKQPLAYLLILVYFSFIIFSTNIIKSKFFFTWNFKALNIFLSLFFFKRELLTIFLKLALLYFCSFYMLKLYLFSNILILFLHFFIILFGFIWSMLYNYYFLFFKQNLILWENVVQIYENTIQFNSRLQLYVTLKRQLLEMVTFNHNWSFQFFLQLSTSVSYNLIFVNTNVLILVILIIVNFFL